MIPEADIVDQWTVVSDCISKPDESHQAIGPTSQPDACETKLASKPMCLGSGALSADRRILLRVPWDVDAKLRAL